MNGKELVELNKKRDKVVKELGKIEKKHGIKLFRCACNRKLTIDRQREKAEKTIKEKEKELERLKSGKPLPY